MDWMMILISFRQKAAFVPAHKIMPLKQSEKKFGWLTRQHWRFVKKTLSLSCQKFSQNMFTHAALSMNAG
jgi:hypothetical protein